MVFRFCFGDVWVVSWRCLVGFVGGFLVVSWCFFGFVLVMSGWFLGGFSVLFW